MEWFASESTDDTYQKAKTVTIHDSINPGNRYFFHFQKENLK